MATEIITSFGQQCDANGDPMNGAKVYVYDVSSTTPKTVYSNTGLSVSVANPIVCDSAGRHDMRYIATGSYKIVVKTSADVTVFTRDNIDGRVPVGSGALAIANGGTGAASAGAALSALGAATAAELADVAADVAALTGASGSTEKTHIATGSTANRPASPAVGDFRRNSTTNRWEGYNNSAAWENFITDTELPGNFAANQAEQEAGTSNVKFITPSSQHLNASAVKGWVKATFAGVATVSYNVSSITDNGTGDMTVNWTTAFSSVNYAATATVESATLSLLGIISAQLAAALSIVVRASTTGTFTDGTSLQVIALGDH